MGILKYVMEKTLGNDLRLLFSQVLYKYQLYSIHACILDQSIRTYVSANCWQLECQGQSQVAGITAR